jgi:hypothetical protein
MDARLDPVQILGIELGSAHVIRNAGGRAADALRSIIISQQLLGTREIVIVHHVRIIHVLTSPSHWTNRNRPTVVCSHFPIST